MKVRFDREVCQGHGRCYALAPDVFGADDDGYGQLLIDGDVPDGLIDQAWRAQQNCPEDAIAIDEGEARQ